MFYCGNKFCVNINKVTIVDLEKIVDEALEQPKGCINFDFGDTKSSAVTEISYDTYNLAQEEFKELCNYVKLQGAKKARRAIIYWLFVIIVIVLSLFVGLLSYIG